MLNRPTTRGSFQPADLNHPDFAEKRICAECGRKLPPRRRKWCSQECTDAWLARGRFWDAMVAEVLRRSGSRCECCGRAAHDQQERLGRLLRVYARKRGLSRFWGVVIASEQEWLDRPVKGIPATRKQDSLTPQPHWSHYAWVIWRGWVWTFYDEVREEPAIYNDRNQRQHTVFEGCSKWAKRNGLPMDRDWIQIDHVVPIANGGAHHIDNLQALCVPCHKAKTTREAAVRACEEPLLNIMYHYRQHGTEATRYLLGLTVSMVRSRLRARRGRGAQQPPDEDELLDEALATLVRRGEVEIDGSVRLTDKAVRMIENHRRGREAWRERQKELRLEPRGDE